MSKEAIKRKRRKCTKKDEEDEDKTDSSRVTITAEKSWWRHLNKGNGKEKEQPELAYSKDYLSYGFPLILIHSVAEEVNRYGCTQKIIHLRSD